MSAVSFDNRVAIVTGAGSGLGRSHALALGKRGVKVMINDLGGSVSGEGASLSAAETVAEEIRAAGGEAIAHGANVTKEDEVADMVAQTLKTWGKVDILVNNAGILRDKSFAKMTMEDFRLVADVHLNGAAICSKAVWEPMRNNGFGRIVMTSSSSGIYGNFGQANYGAAKFGLIGLMNVLNIEGAKYGIKCNALSPTAWTRMTETLFPPAAEDLMSVESVTAGLVYLVCDEAPDRTILCAGAGGYAATRIFETEGIFLPPEQQTPEQVAANFDQIIDQTGQHMYREGGEQTMKFLSKAAQSAGIKLG